MTCMLYSKSVFFFFSLCRKILRRPCKFMLICVQKSGTGRVSYSARWSREENMTWAHTKGSFWTGPEDSATDTQWGRFRRCICQISWDAFWDALKNLLKTFIQNVLKNLIFILQNKFIGRRTLCLSTNQSFKHKPLAQKVCKVI